MFLPTATAELRAEAIITLIGRAAKTTNRELARKDLQSVAQALNAEDSDVQFEAVRSLARWPKPLTIVPDRLKDLNTKLRLADTPILELLALAATRLKREVPAHLLAKAAARPTTPDDWIRQTKEGGNIAAGRRAFFHAFGAGCFKCHTVNGRGGQIGPDLSTIARSMNRRKLAEVLGIVTDDHSREDFARFHCDRVGDIGWPAYPP